MSKLLYHLPPLAPDYSGVASVFHDLGALTVIHDASGCTGTYTGYDEPRWFGSPSPVFCSGLRDMDAIMGGDDRLLARISAALADTGAPFTVVIGSPVPMVTGFDFAGFAALAEARTGRPCLAFPTTGLGYYDEGQRAAYLAIAERFLGDDGGTAGPAAAPLVNILGASALDGFSDDARLDGILALLARGGLVPGAVWGMRSGLDALRATPRAAVNWVVTAAALPLARRLEAVYHTPYVAGLPLGEAETARILAALKAPGRDPAARFPPGCPPADGQADDQASGGSLAGSLGRSPAESLAGSLGRSPTDPPAGPLAGSAAGSLGRSPAGARALLVGEGLYCASLRAKMADEGRLDGHLEGRLDGRLEGRLDGIRVGGFFRESARVFAPGDRLFASEADAAKALAEEGLELVVADPLLRDLLPPGFQGRFDDAPHRAVSGRLFE